MPKSNAEAVLVVRTQLGFSVYIGFRVFGAGFTTMKRRMLGLRIEDGGESNNK